LATILVIDDSKHQRREVRNALKAAGGFDRIVEAEDGIKGLSVLLSHEVDLVLCDLEMPGLDGEKLLQAAVSKRGSQSVPFLFVTGSTDIARRVRLLERGAQDVIRKPFHPAELVARLKLHLQIRQLTADLSARNLLLEELSTTDELTRLRNRRYVCDALEREVHGARRHGTTLSILMIDLDHFKEINDEYGHVAGDAVLRETGLRIRSPLRGCDIAARYGGEEFLILLSLSDQNGALTAAERWRAGIGQRSFTLPDGKRINVTASIGVATFSPRFASAGEFIAAADTALYRAKEEGRDCVRVIDVEAHG
jgi:diguanylate cyclase (GGDEF)-like protein